MRLLVSVRSAAEVGPAVSGGAQIVDAKEPSAGSLGAVTPAVLAAIAFALPRHIPLSVALGDPADDRAAAVSVSAAFEALEAVGPRAGAIYLKLGLASASGVSAARRLVDGAMGAVSDSRASVVVVAYADHEAAETPAPGVVSRVAADAGAHGVLLDTWRKDGRDLFQHMTPEGLREWIDALKEAGLLVALGGSLDADGIRAVARLPADVVGVRGAACEGGREGVLLEERVRALRRALESAAFPRGDSAPAGSLG
jgi:(5-formylfuran-3-yl)methyl phosphate synthase